ncbi:hypothetical protein VPHD530_0024 [Vibrio phage D530]
MSQNFVKIKRNHVVPEEEFVPRKYRTKKQKRGSLREAKRSFGINDDKQEFGKHSLRR